MTLKYFFVCFLSIFLCLNLSLFSQQQQEKIQEKAEVTAAEVPVRVIYKGQAVKDLGKEDFALFENGVKQKITAFEVVSRKISAPDKKPNMSEKAEGDKRVFILIFNIFDYNDTVGEAIDYFFNNFFMPGDRVVIIVEDQLLNIKRGGSLEDMILNLKNTLKQYKQISTLNIIRAYNKLNVEAGRLLNMMRDRAGGITSMDQAIINFYNNYITTWRDYKKQFIMPDLNLYQSVVNRIKQIEGEKWAICFQQREMFPKLKRQSSVERAIDNYVESQIDPRAQVTARFIRTRQMEMQRLFDVSGNFPAEALKNLFMESNMTFHLVLLKSFRTLGSQDFELKEVSQDYEDCFKDISNSTGGLVTFSNKLSEALVAATEKEDNYYLLVYNPKGSQEAGKRNIEVRVHKEGVKVIYLKHFSGQDKPAVAINDFKSGGKKINFSLNNYGMVKTEGKLTGIAEVKITIYDENSQIVFDEQKILQLIKKDTEVSLSFDWLKSGSYFIIIQVTDKISETIDVFSDTIKF